MFLINIPNYNILLLFLCFTFLLSARKLNQETSRHASKELAEKKVDFRLEYLTLIVIDSSAPKETR